MIVAGQWQLAAAQPSVMRALEPTAGSDANVAPHAAGQPILTLLVNENPCGCLFSRLRRCRADLARRDHRRFAPS